MSQDAVAGRLGISRVSLSAWERDRAFPDMARIGSVCEAYDLTSEERIELAILLGVLRGDDLLAAAA